MDDCGRERPSLVMLGWLGHPVTVLAVLVLVINDHLLKAAYPGLITGKLSDLAGLVVTPPLLAILFAGIAPGRSGTAVALSSLGLTGLAFAIVKATSGGAVAASAIWSAVAGPSVILADRTDLAALPALGLAGWAWTRARRRPATRRSVRRFGVLVMVPAATLAVAATSAPIYPDAVAVVAWRDLIAVGLGDAYRDDGRYPKGWWVSDGDGRVWRFMTEDEGAAFDRALPGLTVDARRACVPGDPAHCYRVVPGHLRVEETADGGDIWRVSWEVSDDRRAYLARAYEGVRDPTGYLSSQALVVHPTPDGHVVVVANGRDGAAVRDAAGHWRRIAFVEFGSEAEPPAPLDGNPWIIGAETILAALAALVVIGVGGWRSARRGNVAVTGFVVTLVVGGVLTMISAPLASGLGLGREQMMMPVGVVVAGAFLLVAFVGAVGILVQAGRVLGVGWRWLICLIGLFVGAGCFALFLGWAYGETSYRQSALLGIAATLGGAAFAGWLGHRFARPPWLLPDPAYPDSVEPSPSRVPPEPASPPNPSGGRG